MNYRVRFATFSVVREPSQSRRLTINHPEDASKLARALIPDDAREHFSAIGLDSQNGVVATWEVSVGTLAASLVHPREVFGPAIRIMGIASIILTHNHPSGDATPSREDIRLTKQLVEAGTLLDIRIHDHVIIGSGNADWTSLAQRGVI